MSLRPDQILVGHVYRGADDSIGVRMVDSIVHGPIHGAQKSVWYRTKEGYKICERLKDFARWAVADITQEEQG